MLSNRSAFDDIFEFSSVSLLHSTITDATSQVRRMLNGTSRRERELEKHQVVDDPIM